MLGLIKKKGKYYIFYIGLESIEFRIQIEKKWELFNSNRLSSPKVHTKLLYLPIPHVTGDITYRRQAISVLAFIVYSLRGCLI